jgi:hypothetical protein
MNFIEKWIARVAYKGLQQPKEEARTNKLHDMFQNNMPAMVAFRIDNGYVVRTMNPEDAYVGSRLPGFVYCADHQAIADHLVSSAMRERLGVHPAVFEEQKRKMSAAANSVAAGLVGATQVKSY